MVTKLLVERVLGVAAGLVAACVLAGPASAQPMNEGIQPKQVDRAVALENVKVDLAFCASELDELQGAPGEQELAESVENPQCRAAVLKAQSLGLSKAQIVTLLMGSADVPDPDPNQPPAQPDAP